MDPLHATAAASGAADAPPPWWRGAVVYENHLPSLRDGDGDGIGDLEGLIQSLDYLGGRSASTRLGRPVLSLAPGSTQGYDVSDFTRHRADVRRPGDVRPADRRGAPARHPDPRRLRPEPQLRPAPVVRGVARLARQPAARLVRLGRPGARRRPAQQLDRRRSAARPGSWDERHRPVLPALASCPSSRTSTGATPTSRAAMLDVLRFWLDRGVDGFRIDVAHLLMKDPELRDNPPSPSADRRPFELQHADFSQLHVNDRCHPDVHGVMREIRAVVDDFDDRSRSARSRRWSRTAGRVLR